MILYVKDNCPECTKIERMLIAKNITFTEKNIENEDTLVELVSDGALLNSVPIMRIDDEFIYDTNKMREMI